MMIAQTIETLRMFSLSISSFFFFLNDTPPTEISPFPLHAPLPIYVLPMLGDFMPKMEAGDAAIIAAPVDFLGVNYYYRTVIRKSPDGNFGAAMIAASPASILGM